MNGWWLTLVLTAALGANDPAIPPLRVDAVVTDRAGRPILDLKPSDFELRENGIVLPIEQVTLPAGNQAQRLFAIFLDEYHVGSGAPTSRLKAALAKFIDDHLRAGDRAVVVKPLEPVSSLEFSSDKSILRAAVDGFSGRKEDYSPRSAFEEQYIGRAASAVKAARRQIVGSALREIVIRLGEASGDRAVLVLVSDGFPLTPPRGLRQMRVPDLQTLVRSASRAHVAVYAFSPSEGGVLDSADAATLEWLAAQTGGRSSADGLALDANLQRMSSELDARYALTYRPSRADGRFHPLQITAKRQGAVILARPGYWAPFGSDLRLAEPLTSATVPPRSLRRSAAITVWTGLSRADGRTRLEVTWEPAPNARPMSNNRPRLLPVRPEVVTLSARLKGGATLFSGDIVEAGAGSEGRPDTAVIDVPAGVIELDLTLRDSGGTQLDTDTRDISVPELAGRTVPLLSTPRIVRARTAREFRAARENSLAAPSAARVFARGDRLLIRAGAWDPAGAEVQLGATVTNRMGGAMRDLEPATTGDEVTYELPLAWLVPGEYSIVITARSATGESSEVVRFEIR